MQQRVEACVRQYTEPAVRAAAILKSDGWAPLASLKPAAAARRAALASLLPASSRAGPPVPLFALPPSQVAGPSHPQPLPLKLVYASPLSCTSIRV